MPDIARTITQLLALLADNVKGEISPQDIRDLVMTLYPDFAFCHSITDDFSTSLPYTDPNTWVPINCNQTLVKARNFDITTAPPATPNALRYIGAPKRTVLIHACVIGNSQPGHSVKYRFTKNGNVVLNPDALHFASTPTDPGAAFETSMYAIADLVTNDTIKVELAATGGVPVPFSLQSQELIALALPALS